MYGSGQWTVPDGYAASKLFKGGWARTTSRPTRGCAWPAP